LSVTIELLLTYPVRDGAVLLAKFLAAFALYALMIALTLLYPAIIWYFAPLEWGPILTAYVGLLLMGGAFIAVGVFASSLTENQIVAALVSFLILLMFYVVGWSADFADPALAQGRLWWPLVGAGVVLVALPALRWLAAARHKIGGRTLSYGLNAMVSIVLVLGVIGFVEALSAKHSARLDLTENKRRSLSPQT